MALRGSANYRRIAADLLSSAHERGREGSAAFVIGLTLAHSRDGVDEALRDLAVRFSEAEAGGDDGVPLDNTAPLRAARALRLFNDAWSPLADSIESGSPEELDLAVSSLLMPLCEAVTILTGERLVNHWPAAGAAEPGPAGADSLDRLLESLRLRRLDADLAEETDAAAIEIIAFLESGARLVELRPVVERYARLLSDVLAFAAFAKETPWLREREREAIDAYIAEAIALFRDKGARDEGVDPRASIAGCGARD